MNVLREFWAGLAPRDRRVLVLGAGALLLIGLWLLAWEPLREARDAARVRATAAQADLAYMRAVLPQLQVGNNAGTQHDGRSLLALADATARTSGVGEALLRVEPISGTQVRVYFEGVGFDALVDWLQQLQAGHGVSPGDFSATRTGVGRVDARVVLERAGG